MSKVIQPIKTRPLNEVRAILKDSKRREKAREKEKPIVEKKKRIPKAPPNFSTRMLLFLSSIVPLEKLRTGSFGAKEIREIGVNWFNKEEGFDLDKIEQAFTDKALMSYHRETLVKSIQAIIPYLKSKEERDLEKWFNSNLQENIILRTAFRKGGVSYSHPSPKEKESKSHHLARAFRGFMLLTVANAFEGGNAKLYFGACPRCGRIFQKNRSDKMYDRKTCQVQATKGNSRAI